MESSVKLRSGRIILRTKRHRTNAPTETVIDAPGVDWCCSQLADVFQTHLLPMLDKPTGCSFRAVCVTWKTLAGWLYRATIQLTNGEEVVEDKCAVTRYLRFRTKGMVWAIEHLRLQMGHLTRISLIHLTEPAAITCLTLSLPKVTRLDLIRLQGPQKRQELASVLHGLTTLRSVFYSVEDHGIDPIAEVLWRHTNLTFLHLEHVFAGDDWTMDISTSLRTLRIVSCLSDDGSWTPVLRSNHTLHELTYNGPFIQRDVLDELVRQNTQLRRLDIRLTMAHEYTPSISQSLRLGQMLQDLRLEGHCFSRTALIEIFDAISSGALPQLHTLSVRAKYDTEWYRQEFETSLLRLCSRSPTLCKLTLGMFLTNTASLLTAVAQNPVLQEMHLYKDVSHGAIVQWLLPAMLSNTTMYLFACHKFVASDENAARDIARQDYRVICTNE